MTAHPKGGKRVREPKYLAWIAGSPCLACAASGRGHHKGVQVCHLRSGSLDHGKRPTGMAERPSDRWTTPMCEPMHRRQHGGNELAFWQELAIDPFDVCQALSAAYERGETPDATIIRFAVEALKRRELRSAF